MSDPYPVGSKFEPLSPWAYVGYTMLFSLPLVGFILLIVFSVSKSTNENLKNYARSYWCWLLIYLVIIAILVVLILAGAVKIDALQDTLNQMGVR